MQRLTKTNTLDELFSGVKPNRPSYQELWERLQSIEYALGDEYEIEDIYTLKRTRFDLACAQARADNAVRDMEALMWKSNDGCLICAHCKQTSMEPFTKTGCELGGKEFCSPKWRAR